ncbi:predicted protein [Uncinocarpus reesii 1704]|uniref:LEA domain protein n=1 Tax=Uncinocarpus reesii (strain UAMH 1704) TaxID=336963 RepID=C4JZ33_UNCRE|nr:uncharacterized protein UREG_07434 [Uncinocarpus reesii 1704]EEP82569.1 predicted protein [Uncinocarpus reesii 1704]
MSFLSRAAPVTRLSIAPARSAVYAASRPALFSTTPQRADKGPIDATKDTLKKADRIVSNAAVKGIEKGEQAGHKIKETFGHGAAKAEHEGKKAAAKGKETAQQAKEKTIDLGEQAREEAEELSGKA